MSYFFTKTFRDALTATPTLMDNATVKVVFFATAPQTDLGAGPWVNVSNTVADLVNGYRGWSEAASIAGYPLTHTVTVGRRQEDVNNYVTFTEYPFTIRNVSGVYQTGLNAPAGVQA